MAKRSEIDLLLVRSGRTEWEDQGRLQGHADLPLGMSGETALVANLNHLLGSEEGLKLSGVVTSPDEASRQTARLLAERTGGAKVRVQENLRAIDLGLWEGLRDDQLVEKYPRAYRQWREDPAAINPPEGEGFVAGQVRLLSALSKVLDKATSSVGVVLRPLEYGIARAVVHGEGTDKVWELVEDGPLTDRVTVGPASLRGVLEQLRAKV